MANRNNSIYSKLEAMQEKAFQQTKDKKHLAPVKHRQKDFFIADIFNSLTFQDDIASMEHPLFALKAGDTKDKLYQHGNISVAIKPTSIGLATIHDKDIWIYCISKLMQAMYEGEEISRTVHFTIYDYLVTTNRGVDGRYYKKAKDALERLRGTSIITNIETDKKRESHGFGLIDSWRVVEEKDGRMIRVSVTLPDWLYRSVISKNVLTISPDYFRLRKPLDRRIYELARKHCGNQSSWKINLDLLRKKTGSTEAIRNFRISIKSLIATNELPDYNVSYNIDSDIVTFNKR